MDEPTPTLHSAPPSSTPLKDDGTIPVSRLGHIRSLMANTDQPPDPTPPIPALPLFDSSASVFLKSLTENILALGRLIFISGLTGLVYTHAPWPTASAFVAGFSAYLFSLTRQGAPLIGGLGYPLGALLAFLHLPLLSSLFLNRAYQWMLGTSILFFFATTLIRTGLKMPYEGAGKLIIGVFLGAVSVAATIAFWVAR